MSEFQSLFLRSFAIHRAISAAITEGNGPGVAIEVSDVIKHLDVAVPLTSMSDTVAAIVSAAQDAGTPIVISEPGE